MCQVLLCPFAIPLMFILSVSKDSVINQRALQLITGICTFRDVVKLTAQFVARNGRQFLTTVMQREQRNYLFDFLRPQHSLFNYFTKLVEQYTKVSESGRPGGCIVCLLWGGFRVYVNQQFPGFYWLRSAYTGERKSQINNWSDAPAVLFDQF